ncbi:NAD(P)H-binding protein [Archangium minus]|uniref:NAD(P)H-binding protein n=1 Tax=Archangium minus TaxID=83450 RepID=A0ABY9WPM1_9BACT|nr:NAD(P)H-binding protein [Archangium minus]
MTIQPSHDVSDVILVTGATGNVGRHVVQQLLAAGVPVRATSRRPESVNLPGQVEVVGADLTQPATLPAALAGVRKVFLYAEPRGIDGFVAAAKAAGVKHVVLLSSSSVVAADAETNPIARLHLDVERPLQASGIPWTFIRPGAFATNSLMWAHSIRSDSVVRTPYPESHSTPIHEEDLAEVAVRALLDPGHENASYVLSGPESLTQRRQVELIAEAIGRPVRLEVITPARAREEMSRVMPPMAVDALLRYQALSDGSPLPVQATARDVTGRPARTFAQWARDHASDFR